MDKRYGFEHMTPAQASMADALESLLCKKPLSSIDVKQLCDEAHVARSTFYTHYGNIDELMEQLEDIHIARITAMNDWVASPGMIDSTSLSPYEPTLDYLEANSAFFYAELIIRHNGRLSEKWKDAIKAHLRKRLDRETGLMARTDFLMEVAASVVVSACIFWLNDPSSVPREDVHAALSRSLEILPAFTGKSEIRPF